MFKKLSICLTLALVYCLALSDHALSWNEERTHRDLSSFALDNSVLGQSKGNYLESVYKLTIFLMQVPHRAFSPSFAIA